jgi:hypothetical protein
MPSASSTEILQHIASTRLLGVGNTGADVALPYLENRYDDRSHSLARAGERDVHTVPRHDFEALLEHKLIWKDPGRFALHIRVQHHTLPSSLVEVCCVHKALKDTIKEVQDRGGKTRFGMVTALRDGSVSSRDLEKNIDLFHGGRVPGSEGHEEARRVMEQLNIGLRTR